MSLIIESWRGYISEQEAEPETQEVEVTSDEIQTVGQLRIALRNYKIKKTGKGILNKIIRKGVESIPVVGPAIGIALDSGGLARNLYGGDLEDKNPLPGLSVMRVDPDVSKIVDDDIEKEFLKVLSQELEDFNTTGRLQSFIASRFNQKTVQQQTENSETLDTQK